MAYVRLTPLLAVVVSMLSFAALSQSVGPNWKLEDNQRHVTVTFPTTPPVALQLGVAGREDILTHLGDFRSVMLPAVSNIYRSVTPVKSIPDPRWMTDSAPNYGNALRTRLDA